MSACFQTQVGSKVLIQDETIETDGGNKISREHMNISGTKYTKLEHWKQEWT